MSSEEYWIEARSAEAKAGRGRERDKSDEVANFERRPGGKAKTRGPAGLGPEGTRHGLGPLLRP